MPYISATARAELDHRCPRTPGELTYQITGEILAYLRERGLSFQTIAEIVGALEQTKDEFQRRVVHGYESRKASDNGDVYAA